MSRLPRFVLLGLGVCVVASQLAAQKKTVTAARAVGHQVEMPAAEKIRAHVKFLSSDLLEGRGTGQRGGDIAAEYIATQFALYGLKPAGDHGPYMQKVPMVSITSAPETTFSIVPSNGSPAALKPLDQYVAYDQTQQPESDVDAEIV